MEITWHGNICFTCRERAGLSILLNPSKENEKLKGDVVLMSSEYEKSTIEGAKKTFDWPGEYEVGDVPILGFQAWTKSRSKEETTGKGDNTTIFCFHIDGVKVCHLGELGHILTSDMVNEIGDVDVLMIKIGKNSNLDFKKIREIIEAIEPRVIIPMGENDFSDNLLKEIGIEKSETQEKFVLKSASELPTEQMRCVVLSKS